MTEAQARELIAATFAAGWPAASGGVPFSLENEAFPSADTFVHCTVTLTTSRTTTQGARGTRREQTSGWIQVKLWTPAGGGVAAAAALAGAARSLFRQQDLLSPVPGEEPLRTQSPVTMTIGSDGRWFMQLVRTPFWYVETV